MPRQARLKLYLLSVLLYLPTAFGGDAFAEGLYAEAGTGMFKATVSSTTFRIPVASVRFGGYLLQGVALELNAMAGLADQEKDAVEVNLDYSAQIQTRFESPERKNTHLFILLGYGQSALDINRSDTGQPGSQDFKSGQFGAGAGYRFKDMPDLRLNLHWQRLYAQGGIEMEQAGLGLSFRF